MAKKKKNSLMDSLTVVTPFSKLLAALLFVTFPIFAFVIGMQYGIQVAMFALSIH